MSSKAYKPPSRKRYEKENPTISVRVTKELYNQLLEFREMSGKSLGDILREAMHKQASSTQQAYNNGYNDAMEKYAVMYPCSCCNWPITVSSDKERDAIAKYMKNSGWHHNKCPCHGK